MTININAPTDTPPVNINDLLTFTANAVNALDENPADNTFNYVQTITGSYDPNNIICLEGDVVSPSAIGNYLHYVINFENTGTGAAENIVVQDAINTSQFDLSSLQLLHTSHDVTARVVGETIEFIFENINLDIGGHGNILLKIKSKNNLVVGDMVSKQANIFFDYNFPVETNLANTTFQSLSVNDNIIDDSISVYPNPVKEIVNINSIDKINSVSLYDVQGRLLFVNLANGNTAELNLASNANGIYFLKIKTQSGTKTEKIIKE